MFLRLYIIMTGLLAAGGCGSALQPTSQQEDNRGPGLQAGYAGQYMLIDGELDEAVWKQAKVYELRQAGSSRTPEEGGKIRLAWDDEYLYVAADLEDSDMVSEALADERDYERLGDLIGVFLTPDQDKSQTWHWRLCVTPTGRQAAAWFPGRGRIGLASNMQYQCGLRVATKVKGSVNNWRDKDKRWTAELAMPIRDITARGESFGPDARWRILIVRYNYSRYRSEPGPEVTTTQSIPESGVHVLEAYMPLRLVK